MVAWLITMVPGVEQRVITVLNHRLSSRTVGKYMEQLYVEHRMGLSTRLEYAKSGISPCPARFTLVDGVPYADELWCGSGDRCFWARKVEYLRVTTDEHGSERLVWRERKCPDLSKFRDLLGPKAADFTGDRRETESGTAPDPAGT